jgi:hypothetical protein
MPYDIRDPRSWPDATVVVRGGVNLLEEIKSALQRFGGFSVVSWPDVAFIDLAASVRNNQLRRTTVKQVLDAGGWLIPTDGDGEPPNHCNLFGLTAEDLDSILSEPEVNPVPKDKRWRGTPT